jgi:hypothetical protein
MSAATKALREGWGVRSGSQTKLKPDKRHSVRSASHAEPGQLSPITRAEMAHLRGVDSGRWSRWVTRFLFGALIASVLLTGCLILLGRSAQNTVNIRQSYAFFSGILRTINLALLAAAVAEHLILVWKTLLFASQSISREKRSGTWDTLVLTRMSARQIVIGKWWGVVSHIILTNQHGILLRGAMIFWFGMTAEINAIIPYVNPGILSIMLALFTVFYYTGLSLFLAASVGMLASFIRIHGLNFIGALATQIMLVGAFFGVDLLLHGFMLDLYLRNSFPFMWLGRSELYFFRSGSIAVTLIDGGLLNSFTLLRFSFTSTFMITYLVQVIAGGTMYSLSIAGFLILAMKTAVRNSAAKAD